MPTAPLPPVAKEPDAPGTKVRLEIGPEGGRVVTADNRLALDVPAGAVDRPVIIMIERLSSAEVPFMVSHPLLGVWSLEALVGQDDARPVGNFLRPIRLTVRESNDRVRERWLNPRSLRLWTLDKDKGTWLPVDASVDESNLTVTADLAHFSVYALSANPDVDLAPFSDLATVDLNSGASRVSIPIELPAGPGGLAPDLTLTYDSTRVGGMRTNVA